MNNQTLSEIITQLTKHIQIYKRLATDLAYSPTQIYQSLTFILNLPQISQLEHISQEQILKALNHKLKSSPNIKQELTNSLLNLQTKIALISQGDTLEEHQPQEPAAISITKKEEKKKKKEKINKGKYKQAVGVKQKLQMERFGSMCLQMRQNMINLRKIELVRQLLERSMNAEGKMEGGMLLGQLQVWV